MGRLLQFRTELMMLWRAFVAPQTPIWLKGLMLLVPLYLLSPLDLIPDFIPIAGWLDDVVVIPLLVSWIVSRRSSNTLSSSARRRRTFWRKSKVPPSAWTAAM